MSFRNRKKSKPLAFLQRVQENLYLPTVHILFLFCNIMKYQKRVSFKSFLMMSSITSAFIMLPFFTIILHAMMYQVPEKLYLVQ
jgi:hypothetical protein